MDILVQPVTWQYLEIINANRDIIQIYIYQLSGCTIYGIIHINCAHILIIQH